MSKHVPLGKGGSDRIQDLDSYDGSWDSGEGSDSFDRKMEEWEARDWTAWLRGKLTFPFEAKREDDDDDAIFSAASQREPFRLGHKMKVVALDPEEDENVGLLARVREGTRQGHVPLADLAVMPKTDGNYWPVREYAVWMANH